jgi:flagella synthesis protein FlgN
MRQFVQALESEHASITERDPTALRQAIDAKQHCLELLETLNRDRTALIESAGHNADRDGTENCLQWFDNSGKLLEQWRQLLDLASQCREMNLLNHHLVELVSRQTYQALCILRGQEPEPSLYSPRGGSEDRNKSRILAKA